MKYLLILSLLFLACCNNSNKEIIKEKEKYQIFKQDIQEYIRLYNKDKENFEHCISNVMIITELMDDLNESKGHYYNIDYLIHKFKKEAMDKCPKK